MIHDPLTPNPGVPAGVRAADRAAPDTSDAAQPVSEAELEDVMNDPSLSLEERQARLQDLAARLPDRGSVDHAEAFAPMELRIGDALAMLAEGGHSYGMATPSGLDDDDGQLDDASGLPLASDDERSR